MPLQVKLVWKSLMRDSAVRAIRVEFYILFYRMFNGLMTKKSTCRRKLHMQSFSNFSSAFLLLAAVQIFKFWQKRLGLVYLKIIESSTFPMAY